jgi:hypothetical protein
MDMLQVRPIRANIDAPFIIVPNSEFLQTILAQVTAATSRLNSIEDTQAQLVSTVKVLSGRSLAEYMHFPLIEETSVKNTIPFMQA